MLRCLSFSRFFFCFAGNVVACQPHENIKTQFSAVRKFFPTEYLRSQRIEFVVRGGPDQLEQWKGEGSPADAVLAPLDWTGDAWTAIHRSAACLVFAHSAGQGATGDSRPAVMHVLATGIAAELHREARRRLFTGAGRACPARLQRPVLVLCLPSGWQDLARQDADAAALSCRIWLFQCGPGGPPVGITRSWLATLWDAMCYAYNHCL